ncbi:MAG: 8-oxo-dGTP diphosphatase [Nocardioidaceae bacterium]|nr:8-oxo-dGTP diphosphatase [Nocardioidaceae bacterium]
MSTEVAAAAIVRYGRVLTARRTRPASLAGGWELPGGKVLPGESSAEAAEREVREELGCEIEVGRRLAGSQALESEYALTVHLASLVSGEPLPREHDAVRWLGPEELSDVGWLPADRPFVAQLGAVLLDGTRLPGGNVGGAVRVGGTVRRARGPWTPSVHALLMELRGPAGLVEVPRVYGFDERDREVLEYLPGRVPEPDLETPSEELLGDAMRWLRRFHDAVEGASLPGPWRETTSAPGAGELLCHNDFAPYNVSVSTSATGERLVGVFDWDLAGPATRLEDLAFAAWNWVPMWQVLPAATAAYRLEVMAAAYRDVGAEQILDGVVPRIEKTVDLIRVGLASGDAGMANLASVGEPQRTVAALDALRGRVPDVRAALSRRGAT